MAKWTDKLTVSDIPEQYQQLARLIGVQNLLRLADTYGGDKPYIPKREALLRTVRNRMIRRQYTGYNAKELARYYGLTTMRITQICKDCADETPEVSRKEEAPKQETAIDAAGDQYTIWNCR